MMTYSLVVIIVNLQVFQITSVHGIISLFFLIFSIFSFYLLTYFMGQEPSMFYFGIFQNMIKNIRYFFIVGCLCIGMILINAGFFYISKLCSNDEIAIKHEKILFQFYKKKEDGKKKKKNKKKSKNKKGKDKDDKKNIQNELIKSENAA